MCTQGPRRPCLQAGGQAGWRCPEKEAGGPQRGPENAKGRRGLGLCGLVSQAQRGMCNGGDLCRGGLTCNPGGDLVLRASPTLFLYTGIAGPFREPGCGENHLRKIVLLSVALGLPSLVRSELIHGCEEKGGAGLSGAGFISYMLDRNGFENRKRHVAKKEKKRKKKTTSRRRKKGIKTLMPLKKENQGKKVICYVFGPIPLVSCQFQIIV